MAEDRYAKIVPLDYYHRKGVLWEAFEAAKDGERAVVLLDDIDRAGDRSTSCLENVLGTLSFVVPETAQVVAVSGDVRPLVVLTTNEARELDDRLARRCVRLMMRPPSAPMLVDIAAAHGLAANRALVDGVVSQFVAAQSKAAEQRVAPLGTAEYLDVLRAHVALGADVTADFASLLVARDHFSGPSEWREPAPPPQSRDLPEAGGARIFLCHSSGDKQRVRQPVRGPQGGRPAAVA